MLVRAEGCFPVLRANIRAKKVSVETLAGWCGISVPAMQFKLAGINKFKLDEAIAIRKGLGSNEDLEVLFQK